MPVASPPSAPAPHARLWTLDVLRGLSALLVFLSHWHLWSNFPPEGAFATAIRRTLTALHDSVALLTWPTGGNHPAVVAFFVLSGFCIHYPFARRALAGAPTPDWRDYLRRRFWRIMPVYWAACTLGALFTVAQRLWPSGNPLLELHALGDATDLIVRFAAIGALIPREIFAGNYILLTVTSEIVLYALYPVFYRYAMRGCWRVMAGLFIAAQLASIVLFFPYFATSWVFNSVLMIGVFWYLGALAAHLFLHGRGRVSLGTLLLLWAVFLVLKATPHFFGLNLLKQAAWGLVCAACILYAAYWETGRSALAPQGPLARQLRWCGDISYSLYAMHTPAIMLATWTLQHLGWNNYLLQLAVTFTFSAIAVLSVHYGIERRFHTVRAVPKTA